MKRNGTYCGISFLLVKWCIYHLAYEYKAWDGTGSITLYANNLTELKKEIEKSFTVEP